MKQNFCSVSNDDTLLHTLRYGENPHQHHASLYAKKHQDDDLSHSKFSLVGGERPSYINITDLDRLITIAIRIASGFEEHGGVVPIAIAVKHGNVCGASVGTLPFTEESSMIAVKRMIYSDPQAISGGSILLNFPVTKQIAHTLRTHLIPKTDGRVLDLVCAPEFSPDAKERLLRKDGKCRMFENQSLAQLTGKSLYNGCEYRLVRGGIIAQEPNRFVFRIPPSWKEHLTVEQERDLILAWGIGSTATSNSIVLVHDGMLVGRGFAQPSRVFACKVAILYARENGHGEALTSAVAYSDSFFPFPDGPKVLADAGIKTIFATSGSIRDNEVMEVCKQLGVRLLQLPDKEARGFSCH